MRKMAMVVMLLFTVIGSTFAQYDGEETTNQFKRGIFNHVALNVGAGLEGVSVGVAAPVTNFLEVEAGVNIMPSFNISGDLDIPQVEIVPGIYTPANTKVNAEGSLSRTTVNLKAFVYPFGGNTKFFVAGGFSFGGKKIAKVSGSSEDLKKYAAQYPQYRDQILQAASANLGGYNLSLNEDFEINGDIRCNSFRPYLGLGFGRAVPKNRIGFRFELGCQFMGRLKVYQDDQELNLDKILEDAGDDDISKIVKDIKVYPCLKFSIVGRIL